MPKLITEMYAFVATEEDGTEGVPAFMHPVTRVMFPLTGVDMERVVSLIPVAQDIADSTRRPMKIVRFTQMEKIGEINPR